MSDLLLIVVGLGAVAFVTYALIVWPARDNDRILKQIGDLKRRDWSRGDDDPRA